jgi:hypothetical protein
VQRTVDVDAVHPHRIDGAVVLTNQGGRVDDAPGAAPLGLGAYPPGVADVTLDQPDRRRTVAGVEPAGPVDA